MFYLPQSQLNTLVGTCGGHPKAKFLGPPALHASPFLAQTTRSLAAVTTPPPSWNTLRDHVERHATRARALI